MAKWDGNGWYRLSGGEKFSNGEGHRLFELFKRIRPKPAVNWIVGPRYSFGVFSMSRFAHLALSSVDDPN